MKSSEKGLAGLAFRLAGEFFVCRVALQYHEFVSIQRG